MTKLKQYLKIVVFIMAGLVAGVTFVVSCDREEKVEAMPSCDRYQVAVQDISNLNDTSNPLDVPQGWTPLNVAYGPYLAMVRCAP